MKRSDRIKEIRAVKPEDIGREIQARKKELMELRFQGTFSRLANPHRLRELRREVAQLNTVRREQQLKASSLEGQGE